MLSAGSEMASDQIGLVLPTSLCAGEIGKLIVQKLNGQKPAGTSKVSRYVALAHTEGCGASSGESEEISLRTMAGYLCHPLVRRGLLLEHGCEKTHNDALREFFDEQGIDHSRFGRASVQLDGGLENVTEKVVNWFAADQAPAAASRPASLQSVRLGLSAEAGVPDNVSLACATMIQRVISFGGTVVLPETSSLLRNRAFTGAIFDDPSQAHSTLAYGQHLLKPGFHVMQCPTTHEVETLTGLGATGVEVMLIWVAKALWQSHPMVPLLQVSSSRLSNDLDLVFSESDPRAISDEMLSLVVSVLSRRYTPRLLAQGNTDFQMTRGFLGVSL